ncbi:unnamed protein product, partial [Candidula unifasciata]
MNLCQLPSDSGSCRNFTIRWFYDSKKQDCARFWYGGCHGNENRFDDSETCKRRCFKEPSCGQPKDAGTCNNYTLHWHFEVGSASCRQFWYGGCGGNKNRFTSLEACQAECMQ